MDILNELISGQLKQQDPQFWLLQKKKREKKRENIVKHGIVNSNNLLK